MSWNAFDEASSEEVKHQESLMDPCEETIAIGSVSFKCEKLHLKGEVSHSAVTHDNDGKVVLLEWTHR